MFETLQVYLGSLYVNDFNRFGRTYQVNVQAESAFRLQPEQIARLKTRNAAGAMVPLGSLVTVEQRLRARSGDALQRLPGRRDQRRAGAGLQLGPGAGGDRRHARREQLPRGMALEWTELAYQEMLAGNTMLLIFPLCVLLVYVVLAAQYESWTLPLSVILIVPMTLLSAHRRRVADRRRQQHLHADQLPRAGGAGVQERDPDRRVRASSAKHEGDDRVSAILDACRVRLRPVLMTSVAFIMGVVPLVFSTGAGAEIRQAMGVAVFAGMLGVTVFGLFLTPVFYVVIGARWTARDARAPPIGGRSGRHPRRDTESCARQLSVV